MQISFDVMKQAPPALSKLRAVFDKRLKGGAMNTIYIGVDFHARQQTICYLTTETGELVTAELKHEPKTAVQSREVMRMLRYRQKLIKMRTMSKNSLQSLALQSGIARRGRLFTREGKAELEAAVMSPAMEWQRAHWWQLLEPLNQQVLEAMTWLKAASQNDVSIARLRTHPGIGLLTSLCLVHTLQPVARFRNTRKVAAYAGFEVLSSL